VRPTTGQFNRFTTTVGKGPIRRITIALQRASEVDENHLVQTLGGPAGFPAEKNVAGVFTRPSTSVLMIVSSAGVVFVIATTLRHL
jgi:hypothetical protein